MPRIGSIPQGLSAELARPSVPFKPEPTMCVAYAAPDSPHRQTKATTKGRLLALWRGTTVDQLG